jgi:hypothetical protein
MQQKNRLVFSSGFFISSFESMRFASSCIGIRIELETIIWHLLVLSFHGFNCKDWEINLKSQKMWVLNSIGHLTVDESGCWLST